MTDDLKLATARIATTPTQAKLFVAMLKAEGIAAFVEGDSLADEVAVSRQLMNVAGTHVRVRTTDLERANEVLGAVEIDDADLEAQAMAARPAREESKTSTPTSTPTPAWMFLALGLIVVVAIAWKIVN